MELINPNDPKPEGKPELVEGATIGDKKAELAFQAEFQNDGWLVMRVHVLTAVGRQSAFNEMRGFFDSIRDEAMGKVLAIRAQIEKDRQAVVAMQNKQGHKTFLNGLLKRR